MPTLLLRRAVPLTVALAALTPATASAATPVPLGKVASADVAVDAAGAAHVALADRDGSVRHCLVPRGASACARQTAVPMPGTPIGPDVHVQVLGATVLITSARIAGDPDGDGPAVAVSTDGGATFAPGVRLGSSQALGGQQVVGPDGALWNGVMSGGFLNVVRTAFDGSTPTTTERLIFDGPGAGVDRAGFAITGNVAVAVRPTQPMAFFAHAVGSADPHTAAAWSPPGTLTPVAGKALAEPSLAAGPKGMVLTTLETGDLEGLVTARRWTGSGFGAPTVLYRRAGGSNNANNGEVVADASGRFHAVFTGDNGSSLRYARSSDGGATWGPAQVLTTSPDSSVLEARVSAAADGQGFAVAIKGEDWFAIPLEPTAGLPGEPTVSTKVTEGDTDLLLGLPRGCLPAGDVRVTLTQKARKVKRRRSTGKRVVVKVTRVDFSIDGRNVKTDRRAAFTQTLRLVGLAPGSTHEVRARAFLKVRSGKQRTRSIRRKVKICA